MATHNITINWTRAGESLSEVVAVTADGEKNFDVTVNASTTDRQVDIAFEYADVKSLYLHSDVNLTLETNSGSSPTQTITLTADVPIIWYANGGYACPFTSNVTKFYFTNATATAATVKFRLLEDLTP